MSNPPPRPRLLDALTTLARRYVEAKSRLDPGWGAHKVGPVTGTPAPPAPINLHLSDVVLDIERTVYRLLNRLEVALGHTKVINLSRQTGRPCPLCQNPTLRFHVDREVAYCAYPDCLDPDTGQRPQWTKSRLPFLADHASRDV